MILQIYRNGTALHFVEIDKSTTYIHEVMGMHEVQCRFISQEVLDIKVDDYILFRDERYTLNVLPDIEKRSNFEYHYNLIFEGYIYWLKDKIFRHLGDVEFPYFGDAQSLVSIVVDNMNEVDTGWEVGFIDPSEPIHIQFLGEERGFSCKGALMKIAEEFSMEFWLTGKTIHLTTQAGVNTNLDFQYGKSLGLTVVRRGSTETPLYNRIYGYGGTTNIPEGYRGRAKRLMFEGEGLERPLGVGERRRETSVIIDEIFPNRTGTLTGVAGDYLKLTDSSLNFDLNGQRNGGEDAKVVFKSGELAGMEFVIDSYDHSTKTITIAPFVEENGQSFPNSTFEAKIGDKYTLTGINLPQVYIDEAEAKLRAETSKVFNTISRPPYFVEVDPRYMRVNGITVKAGDRVRLKDTALGINDMIRVTSVSFPLVDPHEVTFVISDSILYTQEVLAEIDRHKVKQEIVVVDRQNHELARQNVKLLRQLQGKIYDPEGDYFDPENIKPQSIETLMLSVGAKSQNFALNNVGIEANYLGNPNSLRVSGGQLIHFEVEIEGLGFVWNITSQTFNSLVPANSYYLYARCSRNGLTGSWFLSTTPYTAEQEAGVYYFWVGILFPVADNWRGFMFTKGMTFIVGDQITTGTIKSLDGLNYFNLTEGTFKLGNSDEGIDWGVTSAGQLTINGALVSKMVFAEDAEIINLMVKSLRTNLTGQRIEILESDNNLKFYDQSGNLVLAIDDDIDSDQAGNPLAGLRAVSGSQVSYVSGNGLFSNAGGYRFFSAILGIETNASVVGILFNRNSDPNGVSAGVVGLDQTTTGNSKAYGGYFNSAFIGGLNVQTQRISESHTITKNETFISCYNNTPITINLPSNPYSGRVILIRKNNDNQVTVSGNGNTILNDVTEMTSTDILGHSYLATLLFDGQHWFINSIPRQ